MSNEHVQVDMGNDTKFHVSWGPEAKNLTPEQRESYINQLLVETKRFVNLPDEIRMLINIKNVYDELTKAIKYTQTDLKDLGKEYPEVCYLKSKIFGHLDMALLELGNWKHRFDEVKQHEIKEPKV